jgi:hypothetical protein
VMKYLYLCSEAPLFYPRKCRIVKRLWSQYGLGHALVEIRPPLPGKIEGVRDDITHLVMEPHGPLSLFLPRFLWRWPFEVLYSGIRLSEISWTGRFNADTTMGGGFASLYPNEEVAIRKAWNTIVAEEGGTILAIMDRSDISELKTYFRTFEIESASANAKITFDKRRVSLLKRIIFEFPNSHIKCTRDPLGDGLKGNWSLVDGCWRIPVNADVEQIYSWLVDGEWHLYVPRGKTVTSEYCGLQNFDIDLHVKLMKHLSTILLITSFKNNTQWLVSTDWRIRYKEIFGEAPKQLDYLST